MIQTRFAGIADAKTRIGEEIAVAEWLEIDQARVNAFADATGDHQWIHVDAERARRESPFGGPIAHGFLTLSLLAKFAGECIAVDGVRLAVNYGLNRVRFASPVRVGARIRARFVLGAVDDIPGGAQIVWQATVEIEGGAKPACVAEMLTRWYL
jgi:acyl dehydratase